MTCQPTSLGPPIAAGRTAEVYPWGEGRILKLFREWCPAHWIDYEVRIARAVCESGAPAPAVFGITEVDGRRGVVYSRVDGQTMSVEMRGRPGLADELAREFAAVHASIHARLGTGLPSLRERLEVKIRDAGPLPLDMRDRALAALVRLPDEERLCHGDFHPENIVMTEDGPVVIDWVDAARGNPLADVARTRLLALIAGWPIDAEERSWRARLWSGYIRRYLELRPGSREVVQQWLLPVAAARMEEEVPGERGPLLRLIRRLVYAA